MIRLTILILSMTMMITEPRAQGSRAQEFKVGVRGDAVSMSYKVDEWKRAGAAPAAGPLADDGYDGFMVHICDKALSDMRNIYGDEIKITAVQVHAYDMWGKLNAGGLDIICGPTTATQERLTGRIASPPVFVSGVSYASRGAQETERCSPIAGMLRSSTAGITTLRTIISKGAWPPRDVEILKQYLTGGTEWKAHYKDCDAPPEPVMTYKTHDEMAQALCEGKLKHYVGDFEIIARSLQAAKNKANGACDFKLSDRTFSEERYVILGRARSGLGGDSNPLVAHFFEILSRKLFFQPSAVDSAFDSSFPFAEPSRKLDFLFWALRGNRN